MTIVLYIFHRDLRLVDNKALERACELAKSNDCSILPLFIFSPEQVSEKNKYKSTNSIQFMIESLNELDSELRKKRSRLVCCYGSNEEVLESFLKKKDVKFVVDGKDYTPFAKKRSLEYEKICKEFGVGYECVGGDVYLTEPGTVLNKSGKMFQKFTPFYETAMKKGVEKVDGECDGPFVSNRSVGGAGKTKKNKKFVNEVSLELMKHRLVGEMNEKIAVKGGRNEGLELLKKLPTDYEKIHDIPSEQTSMLSAHHHFGTVSIRESYNAGKKKGLTAFVRQLYWRDFYGHIVDQFEKLYGVGPYEYQSDWSMSEEKKKVFESWCKGETGVEMVDAGMTQLNQTGYMHNRVRLVVANWLVKEKKIHWRAGEKYFAQQLVDYDFSMNFGNWVWVASLLPFSQAPFRKVTAEGTQTRFDKEKKYIHTWLGEKE
jgi:deoxyribodipyrimidine photo-lyase